VCGGVGLHWWVGGGGGEKGRRINMLQIMLYMYVNAKMRPVEMQK
jgi:hypothetical protein